MFHLACRNLSNENACKIFTGILLYISKKKMQAMEKYSENELAAQL